LNEATPSINIQHQDKHHYCIEKICGSGSRCIFQDMLTQKTALHDQKLARSMNNRYKYALSNAI